MPLDEAAGTHHEQPPAFDSRLVEAAERAETLEVILVLRGRIRRAHDGRRWRIRAQGGRVVTFASEWVVAATPVPSRPGPGRA